MGSCPKLSRYFAQFGKLLIAMGAFVPLLLPGQTSSPSRILVCASPNDACNQPGAQFDGVWIFNGAEGTVSAPASEAGARLTIEKFEGGSIVIRRIDRGGSTAGLTAVYTGSIRGDHISGVVEWSWPGHPEHPAKGSFSATFEDRSAGSVSPTPSSAADTPSELLVCENGGPCNAAWIFKGSEGTGTWFAQKPVQAKLSILRFASDYIVIRRTGPAGVSATYTGSLHGDRYSGVIVWSTPDQPGKSIGAWTASIPQTKCADQNDIDVAEAMRIGQYALMFKRDNDALDCYVVAANAGDARAETAAGLLYYQGHGAVPQDYAKAFSWLRKAADQGVYAAERTVGEMYDAGLGTQRDENLARFYSTRADEHKHEVERQQDLEERTEARREERAERAADRANQLLSSFILGASFGLFF